MITLDNRPEQRTKITLDTKLIGYKAGLRHGIAIGTVTTFILFIIFLLVF